MSFVNKREITKTEKQTSKKASDANKSRSLHYQHCCQHKSKTLPHAGYCEENGLYSSHEQPT